MQLVTDETNPRVPAKKESAPRLVTTLLGKPFEEQSPSVHDLGAALLTLAAGRKIKALLAWNDAPYELALERREGALLVSLYQTGPLPEVAILRRRVGFEEALTAAAMDAESCASGATELDRQVLLRLAAELRAANLEAPALAYVERRRVAGVKPTEEDIALAFGFEAMIPRGAANTRDGANRADIHALLFEGKVWAWVRGRKIELCQGPIFLPMLNMLHGVGLLFSALDRGRSLNLRLASGRFRFGLRLDRQGEVTFELAPGQGEPLTLRGLRVDEVAGAVLRLSSDLTRAMVVVDRTQLRNLRVQSVRDEVRSLRRRMRERSEIKSFTNGNPDRLRASNHSLPPPSKPQVEAQPPSRLRFSERWYLETGDLDPHGVTVSQDLILLSNKSRIIAVDRAEGQVVWTEHARAERTIIAADWLVRIDDEGLATFIDVRTGEQTGSLMLRLEAGSFQALFAGRSSPPPSLIVVEDRRLVSVDLRSAERRWAVPVRGAGPMRLLRQGRLLIQQQSDGSIAGLDAADGEAVWQRTGLAMSGPQMWIADEKVLVPLLGEEIAALDLYRGQELWRARLPGEPRAIQYVDRGSMVVATAEERLCLMDTRTGETLWTAHDPGLGRGAGALAVDGQLFLHCTDGSLRALSLSDGSESWANEPPSGARDLLPGELKPRLSSGALFVPSSHLKVVSPSDGKVLSEVIPSDLVPDWLTVDPRGWAYIAEENHAIAAYAPSARLRLVRT